MESTRELPPYSVLRVRVDPDAESAGHHHVTAVETWDPDSGRTDWTVLDVIAAIRDGERFIVGRGDRGQTAELGPTVCPRCSLATLSSDPSEAQEISEPPS